MTRTRANSLHHNPISSNCGVIDDVQFSILPFPDRAKDEYEIKLTCSDATVESLIIDAIETRYGREDLTFSLSEFFKQCAGVLIAYGQAAYEI
jgi:hypothetical protein